MRVWICKDHAGHWPVGVASVIVAQDEDKARELLDTALVADGLKPFEKEPYTLKELLLSIPGAYILNDGEY